MREGRRLFVKSQDIKVGDVWIDASFLRVKPFRVCIKYLQHVTV